MTRVCVCAHTHISIKINPQHLICSSVNEYWSVVVDISVSVHSEAPLVIYMGVE